MSEIKLVKRGKGAYTKTYMPKKFEELTDTFNRKSFLNLINSEDRPNAYIFKGLRGTGKSTLAYIFSKWLNCENIKDGEPCLECDYCKSIEAGCPDVIDLNMADKRKLENARELIEGLNYSPIYLKYKVIIMDEVQQMTPDAQESLLKAMDKASDKVIFVLCTMAPRKVEEALVDRCTGEFDFKGLGFDEKVALMVAVMEKEKIDFDYDDLEKIAYEISSSPRAVLKAIQLFKSGGLDAIINKEEEEALNKFAQKLIKGDPSFLKDMSKSKMFTSNSDAEGTRIKLAGYFRKCLLNSTAPADVKKFLKVLGILIDPCYSSDGMNKLVYMATKVFATLLGG